MCFCSECKFSKSFGRGKLSCEKISEEYIDSIPKNGAGIIAEANDETGLWVELIVTPDFGCVLGEK